MKEQFLCFIVAVMTCAFPAAGADIPNHVHPFILWTADEAASIRHSIESQSWAKEQWQRLQSEKGLGQPFRNLFRYQIMGEQAAGESEKAYLLKFIGTHPDKPPAKLDQDNRHYDNYENALRYDVLYDLLTPDQRRQIEDTFRVYIDFQLHHDASTYGKVNWLPNMQWPRPMAAHIMALALGDEALIRDVFNSPGGWKWYFDDYVSDGPRSLYNEEFGKQYSMTGEMLLWCRGLDHLRLPQYGYAYTGTHGGSMRGYLEGIIQLGFPRVEIPGGMPHYPRLTMGDARGAQIVGGPPNLFQHSLVNGYLPDSHGGNDLWSAANMNGRDHTTAKVEKLREPQWLEIARAKWPDAHFDYFLAQLRRPKEQLYTPTLFWGLDPIDPAKVSAPAAPSYVAQERAFAMLRAEESSAYWESPAPAVAMQFASYYVHYTHDCFSLLGFYAYNRPIYLNRGIASGYAGGDPWTDSVRGQAGVVVDNQQARPVGHATAMGNIELAADYLDNPPARFADDPQAKFVLCRARGIYAGVEQTRALILTSDYLLDVFRLTSDKSHVYQWQIHTLGLAKPDANQAWATTTDLDNGALYRGLEGPPGMLERLRAEPTRWDLTQVKKWSPGEQPWSFAAVQECAAGDAAHSIMGKAWYDRQVGVRVSLLGEAETIAYVGNTPEYHDSPRQERGKSERADASIANEVGGVSLIVQRTKPSTTFTALHEPFEHGSWRVRDFRRIQETADGIAVAVTGAGIDDRAMISLGADRNKPVTLAGNGETFTFADRAWVHIGPDQVLVNGDLRSAAIHVAGNPKLILNGKTTPAAVHDATLQFGNP